MTLGERGIELFTLRGLAIQVGWHALKHPNEVATGVATEFALRPIVAHSTSWRHEPAKLIVTYLAIVEPPAEVPPMLQVDPVGRAELARGTATRAPGKLRRTTGSARTRWWNPFRSTRCPTTVDW